MNLDTFVPLDDAPADWEDVLRRARRSHPRRRLVVAIAVVVAALAGAPALAVMLRDTRLQLPPEADRSKVVVLVQPLTRKVVLEAAPWKAHDGFCYVIPDVRAGCVLRHARRPLLGPPFISWTTNPRVVSGTATTFSGKDVPLVVRRFPNLGVTFFFMRGRIPHLIHAVVLRDKAGNVIG